MDEATPLTPFDTMTQTREIQMLKTVIPYMKSSQKKQFAILIKYMELQNTLHIFSQEEQVLSMCSLPEEENNPPALTAIERHNSTMTSPNFFISFII